MTVKKLIKELEKFLPDMNVKFTEESSFGYNDLKIDTIGESTDYGYSFPFVLVCLRPTESRTRDENA